METQPGEVVLLAEEARLARVAIRYALNAASVMAMIPELKQAGIEPLEPEVKFALRLLEDRLPEGLSVIEGGAS